MLQSQYNHLYEIVPFIFDQKGIIFLKPLSHLFLWWKNSMIIFYFNSSLLPSSLYALIYELSCIISFIIIIISSIDIWRREFYCMHCITLLCCALLCWSLYIAYTVRSTVIDVITTIFINLSQKLKELKEFPALD